MKLGNFIEGLTLMAKYAERGLKSTSFVSSEHDTIYFHIGPEPESDDGKKLDELGFFFDEEDTKQWILFT